MEGEDGGNECRRLVKQVYEEEMTGKRPRGRPKKRWTDNFK